LAELLPEPETALEEMLAKGRTAVSSAHSDIADAPAANRVHRRNRISPV
jgi:hypothetical protein